MIRLELGTATRAQSGPIREAENGQKMLLQQIFAPRFLR